MDTCRSCNAPVVWGETPGGKRAPFDPDGANHFISCPDARAWRKGPVRQASLFDEDEPGTEPKPEPTSYPD